MKFSRGTNKTLTAAAVALRLDVVTSIREGEAFSKLWGRRLTLQDADGSVDDILCIEDLVKAPRTQRDEDWPMIRRWVDARDEVFRDRPGDDQVRFWLRESRTPEVLISIAWQFPDMFREVLEHRHLPGDALSGSRSAVQQALASEEVAKRTANVAN